jgi:hypothetical protein
VVEIHKGIGGPQLLTQFLASYDVSGSGKKSDEYLKGLLLQFDSFAALAEFARADINFVNAKSEYGRGVHNKLRTFGRV